jgi:UDP-N-acetylmuramoyl-tripeptide--D-alanyl-D-alanine ligase
MFQQNSYKPREYLEWIRVHSNVGRLLGKSLFAVVSLLLLLADIYLEGNAVCLAFACLANILTIWVNEPRKAKKPLVYTPRVKRMLVTTAILYVICAAVLWIRGIADWAQTEEIFRWIAIALQILFLLLPFMILAVNGINRPIEQGINRHYINDAARILRQMPDLKIIGVTGSYGKTSVKYFLNTLLSSQYNVLQTPGNYNTTLGVVRTIREQLKPYHEIFICEMGAREVGDIK